MTRTEEIETAVFVALGCTKIDMRSPQRAMEAAKHIAAFVENVLDLRDLERERQLVRIFGERE